MTTKRISWKANGFIRREDLDFRDDGSYFKGYEYAGMPITCCTYEGEYYISIRVDYLANEFTWEDWRNTEEYKLEDEFNGTNEVDVEKLKANCVLIAKKVAELNEQVKNEVIDVMPIVRKLDEEIEMAEEVIEDFKKNFKWYECDKYELENKVGYFKSAEKDLNRVKEYQRDLLNGNISALQIREINQRLERSGYVKIHYNDYYLKKLERALGK